MVKKIKEYIKKLIMSFFMLYGYNLIVPAKAIIPINMITVLLLTIFSVPALITLIIVKLLIF